MKGFVVRHVVVERREYFLEFCFRFVVGLFFFSVSMVCLGIGLFISDAWGLISPSVYFPVLFLLLFVSFIIMTVQDDKTFGKEHKGWTFKEVEHEIIPKVKQ